MNELCKGYAVPLLIGCDPLTSDIKKDGSIMNSEMTCPEVGQIPGMSNVWDISILINRGLDISKIHFSFKNYYALP